MILVLSLGDGVKIDIINKVGELVILILVLFSLRYEQILDMDYDLGFWSLRERVKLKIQIQGIISIQVIVEVFDEDKIMQEERVFFLIL